MPYRKVLFLFVLSLTLTTPAQADEAMLRLPVHARLPDGSAAAQARICLMQHQQPRMVVETDSQGVAYFESNFVLTPTLAAESQDGRFSAQVSVPQSDIRRLCQSVLTVTLKASTPVRVRVTRDDVPVANAEVAHLRGFRHVQTDEQGIAMLLLPTVENDPYMSAWHQEKGIGGAMLTVAGEVPQLIELPLMAPVARNIRLLNQFDEPIANLGLTAEVQLSSGSVERFFMAEEFPMTACRTDADGRASFLWSSPRHRPYYHLLDTPDWSMDGEPHSDDEPDPAPKILHVVRARARVPLTGEILVPKGHEKRGILVRAVSDGIGSSFDFCSARSDDNGKFHLMVAPGHTYAIAVEDSEWSSEVRTPIFIQNPPALVPELPPFEIVRAIPLEVVVTSKKSGEPIREQYVEVGRHVVIDRAGEHSRLLATWWKTDDMGRVRTGITTGEYEIRVPGKGWEEKRTLYISLGTPQRVEIRGP